MVAEVSEGGELGVIAEAQVAATVSDGVDLQDAGLPGFFERAWASGDLGREGGFAAGAFIGTAGVVEAVEAEDAFHCGVAHS